ncbi:MAG: glycosyltransferase, partial [Cyclonatronaceae bacterium]
SIPRPIIGFTGSLEYRTDYELVERLARVHHDKQLVFIGPLRTGEMHTRHIADLPNVHILPPRDISELPACTRYMDVLIIPYKKNKLTHSIYPLKLNEYLATGKPVITTHFSPDIQSFSEVVYIAENHDAFIHLVDTAIAENEPARQKKRVACARENSWASRANQLRKLINAHSPDAGRPALSAGAVRTRGTSS